MKHLPNDLKNELNFIRASPTQNNAGRLCSSDPILPPACVDDAVPYTRNNHYAMAHP
jgi:hypothetical protein